MTLRRILVSTLVLGLGFFVLIQLVPYGRAHTNPLVTQEPNWDSARTRSLAREACFDCHSNQTIWPWYSNVAPVSWLTQHDVNEGRQTLNFSEWNRPQREARNASREVARGKMPPPQYLPTHPEANLSAEDRQALIDGLMATMGSGR